MYILRPVPFGALLPVLLLISTPLMALKAPDQGAPAVEPAKTLQPSVTEPKTEPESEDTIKKPVPSSADGGFVPSERIKADSAVSFPVDI
jgi:hypothetical protein